MPVRVPVITLQLSTRTDCSVLGLPHTNSQTDIGQPPNGPPSEWFPERRSSHIRLIVIVSAACFALMGSWCTRYEEVVSVWWSFSDKSNRRAVERRARVQVRRQRW